MVDKYRALWYANCLFRMALVVISRNGLDVNVRLLSARCLCLFLLCMVDSALFAANCTPPPPGLVGWWPGDGNANDIAGTNNGILRGGATAAAPGVVGQAFQFDGTNAYVQIPDSPAFHPTNLTVEAWVLFRTLDTPGHGTYPGQDYIVFKQNSRSSYFEGIALEKDRYPPNVGTNDTFCWETSSASGGLVFLESVTTIRTNVWYFVAGVRGSNYIQLYVNGKLEAQAAVSFPQDYGNLPLYFGTSGESYYDCKFGGLLDEVSLYNRALTSNEIAAVYAAGSAGKCRSLESSSTSLGVSTNPAIYGTRITFTSTVTGSGATPTGTVSFIDGTNILGTSPVDGSGATAFEATDLSVPDSPHLITAVYNADVDHAGSTSGPVMVTINPADLTVTVDNKTRWFGETNPVFTAQFSGFVAGDTTNVLTGSPDLNTTAAADSPPADYSIAASLGTLGASNYTFSFVDGTLTVLALPQLSLAGMGGNEFVFSFPTVSNQAYRVEYNTNLDSGGWLPFGSILTGEGAPVFVTNGMVEPQEFFRLNLQP